VGNVSRVVGTTHMPAPRDLGLPQKFVSWRHNQEEAINEFLDAKTDFIAQCMPTGSGKSLTYVSDAVLSDKSTVILTSTKALQTQLLDDFSEIGMVEIKGKNSYRCVEDKYGRGCDYGDCNFGLSCDKASSHRCLYYNALNDAVQSKLVVTNYAYWLTMNRFSKGGIKGDVDLLVLDEAHHAENHLANIYSFHIRPKEVDSLLLMPMPSTLSTLTKWSDEAYARADRLYEQEKFNFQQRQVGDKDFLRKIKSLKDKVETLRKHVNDPDWLVEMQDGIKFCPIWPKRYARNTLFSNASKVLMTSATVRPKTVEMLGLAPVLGKGDAMARAEVLMAQVGPVGRTKESEPECTFSDYPSIFDADRRLVIHIPTVRVNKSTTKEQYEVWMKRIDQIITPRLHQKGIIHTVSYERRNMVLEKSEYAEYMITHTTDSVVTAVAKFKKAEPPAILVSPSVTTGFDFPYDQARWQILGKLPFPDTRDRLTKARMDRDPEYGAYVAMQSLVQASGRGTRAPNDSCVSFLIDDSAFWFMKRFVRFAPRWFMDGYRTSDLIPQV
jgi:ATP-dependent DNA helicase DinG